jgi:4-aminobutyrate aminotransferase-like enzyme
VHLGLDLFTETGVPVHAPLDGTVHSFADNAGALDYGPTIVLEHRVDGLRFYTLYGHLSRTSLEGLASGQPVARGQRLGWIGAAHENGGWPPHLHLQLIANRLGRRGDFPGVATPSERGIWTSVCPDPSALAGLSEGACAPSPSTGDILAGRRLRLGPSLSVAYRRPLTIVRGFMQHLWDADGRQYLDAVNNVPHVGHGHPRVVAAATRQMAVLNTNTRYLHEALVRYAGRLTALFPPELSVCYFVSSGSEANELALRLARAHTGRHGVVVLDGAYHGNTSSLVDISPYKCEGPGGRGLPPHVRKVPMPDVYRGRYRADDPRAAERYAAHAGEAFEALAADGQAAAAFFAESLMSCGGQIVLPDGYLAEVYRHARAAGVVTVADEVQVGLGRVGSHMWGFETQHVVPDIVTLGKPIGNGYPLGAVVTRREIADSFANGMEYFSTFGGSTAACAVGLAVLDVLEEEQLRQNAARVGAHLETGLRRLADQYPIVGDVRGLGLFLGVELVRDRDRRTPAGDQASYVANRLRDRGVLVSTDGPDHNVLKIKPPMVFTAADADRLVESLDVVLAEDAAQAAS